MEFITSSARFIEHMLAPPRMPVYLRAGSAWSKHSNIASWCQVIATWPKKERLKQAIFHHQISQEAHPSPTGLGLAHDSIFWSTAPSNQNPRNLRLVINIFESQLEPYYSSFLTSIHPFKSFNHILPHCSSCHPSRLQGTHSETEISIHSIRFDQPQVSRHQSNGLRWPPSAPKILQPLLTHLRLIIRQPA